MQNKIQWNPKQRFYRKTRCLRGQVQSADKTNCYQDIRYQISTRIPFPQKEQTISLFIIEINKLGISGLQVFDQNIFSTFHKLTVGNLKDQCMRKTTEYHKTMEVKEALEDLLWVFLHLLLYTISQYCLKTGEGVSYVQNSIFYTC